MIKLRNVERYYQAGRRRAAILQEITLDIREGEFVTVMGPSGAGKTTLLNILGMLDATTKGTVQLDGRDVSQYSDRQLACIRNRRIGFVFQTFHLIHDLSVLDNVQLRKLTGESPPMVQWRAASDHKLRPWSGQVY